MNGNHGQAAQLLATLADSRPDQIDITKKALSEAIGAGRIDIALNLARRVPATTLPTDARMLLVVDQVKRRRSDRALPWLTTAADNGDLSFLAPLVRAWNAAERNDLNQALSIIDQVPNGSLIAPLRAEQRALILLKFRRSADAEPFARRAIGAAGGREDRLRLAFADGFLAAGDRERALMMLDGMGSNAGGARQRIAAGKPLGQRIDTAAEALSEVLTAFAADLARIQRVAPPIGLVQVARYANPRNSSAVALLALLLDGTDRSGEALTLLGKVPDDDAMISQVRDVQVRILSENERFEEAFRIASGAASDRNASLDDFSRLGDLYKAMDRNDAAADAYGRAIAIAKAQGLKSELWTLYLLRASALEAAGRWTEAKAALQQGLVNEPDQPLLLNFLGYAKLERGEDVETAEALIRKASELAPDDASIIDSLGWAQYKRGRVDEAIVTLQRAAEKDPDQAEIQEHLGDALYKAGRRYEARFAWNAALINGEDEIAARVRAKLVSGLTAANGAP